LGFAKEIREGGGHKVGIKAARRRVADATLGKETEEGGPQATTGGVTFGGGCGRGEGNKDPKMKF